MKRVRWSTLLVLGLTVATTLVLTNYLWSREAVPFRFGSMTGEILRPRWLVGLGLLPLLEIARRRSLTDAATAQQMLQLAMRALVIGLTLLALARPTSTQPSKQVHVVCLVDVSASISDEQLQDANQRVQELQAGGDEFSLITFAENARRVSPPKHGPLVAQRHESGLAGSDIQSALELALTLLPAGGAARFVLLSDGNETAGNLVAVAERANELGIRIYWHPPKGGAQPELRLSGIDLPTGVAAGAPFDVNVGVWSNVAQRVTISLWQDDVPNPGDATRTLDLQPGQQMVTFRSEVPQGGWAMFRAKVRELEKDTEIANNEAVASLPVRGRPRVLYVEGSYSREPGSARYLERALAAQQMDVSVRGPNGLPASARELSPFDYVILSDVPQRFLGSAHMDALDQYVRSGGGFLMAGGEDGFGSGGYANTRLEEILPVRFDSEKQLEQPQIALALVMDRSGSMTGAKIEAAKASARATAEVLTPTDLLGVIAFDTSAHVYVPMQRAANRMRISNEIARLQPGGGTNIYAGLREAADVLRRTDAKVKHVILLSDGDAPREGIADLVTDMRAARVTVSCVGVDGADRDLLAQIAERGQGRVYMVQDMGALPRIFMKETQEVQKAQLVEDEVNVRVAKRASAIEGTDVATAPSLLGYVSTKPKPTADVILVSDLGEPVLATWRRGEGTATAWTSDVKNRWSTRWLSWRGFSKFWAQVVRSGMRHKDYESYELSASVHDGRATVVVDAIGPNDDFVNDLVTSLDVADPRRKQPLLTVPMQQDAAGRYVAEFAVPAFGTFTLTATHRRGNQIVAVSRGTATLSYPLEYQNTEAHTERMAALAQATGGGPLGDPASVWQAGSDQGVEHRDLWPYVLWAASALFLADIFLRRLRLFGYRAMPSI